VECFGQLCPPGTRCVVGLEQCAAVEQIQACEGASLEDGAACRYGDQFGICQSGVCASGCGDGLTLGDELCDGINVGASTCVDYGFYAGSLTCNNSCDTIVTDSCIGFCGDGVVNGPEFCDENTLTPGCTEVGYDRGVASCGLECQWPTFGCAGNRFQPELSLAQPTDVYGIQAFGPGRGIIGGRDGVFEIIGGRTRPIPLPYPTEVHDLLVLDESTFFVSTSSGNVLQWTAGEWTTLETGVSDLWFSRIGGSSPSRLWMAADPTEDPNDDLLFSYDGSSWTPMLAGTELEVLVLSSNQGPNGEQLWFLGKRGDVPGSIHLYEGGAWTDFGDLPFDPEAAPESLYVAGPSEVYVATLDFRFFPFLAGDLYRIDYDGDAWQMTSLASPAAVPLTQVWTFDASAASFSDVTAAAVSPGGADLPVLGDTDDALYVGSNAPFHILTIDLSTPATDGTGVWEYWDGTSWSDLSAVDDMSDDSLGLTEVAGVHELSFSTPPDWRARTISGSAPLFYLRYRVSAAHTVAPVVQELGLSTRGLPQRAWTSVSGTGPNNIFATGLFFDIDDSFLLLTELWHFDGTRWELLQATETDFRHTSMAPGIGYAAPFFTSTSGGTQDSNLRRFDGSSWRELTFGDGFPSGTGMSGAALVGEDQLIAVSRDTDYGFLWRYDPARGWDELPFPGGGVPLNDAWTPDGNTVFAVGDDGVILVRYGNAWLRFDLPGAPKLNSVSGTAATDAYAVGQGAIFHFDGATWTKVYDAGSVDLSTITTGSDGVVFVGGTDCTLLMYDRGQWTDVVPAMPCAEPAEAPIAMWAVRGDLVHVAVAGLILVFDGTQWIDDKTPGTVNYLFEDGVPVTHFFGTGEDDVISDAFELSWARGTGWWPMNSPDDFGLVTLGAIVGNHRSVYLVGTNGQLWKLTRTWPWVCQATETQCSDRMDDDCDGQVDSLDPDCGGM